ncbi:hypothetical protein SAMN04487935_3401 [Flavobacterium noncentrifugens]|uniref:Uncharacterized protein n=1 Tax=Flavobacterium noncentrifugens TaxID=1128970 RepID=A0A1G9BZU6_9FLAO|nr:hypothetical protein SAMN04487935_3401 [Flavobacterium noncentrifugens]
MLDAKITLYSNTKLYFQYFMEFVAEFTINSLQEKELKKS